jgi:hypothetical protein
MKVQELGEFSLDRAKELEITLEQIQPGLEELSEQLEEGEKSDTGELRMTLSAEGIDHPTTSKINRALGFLAYNEILELEQRTVWMKSASQYNEFYLDEFDRDRYEMAKKYVSSRIDDLEPSKYNKSPYDFDGFEEFISAQRPAD